MLLFRSTLLFVAFTIALVKGEINLKIIKNENEIQTAVLSFVETRSGTNFSLECHVVNTENGNKLKNEIVWEKKRGKWKFSKVCDLKIPKENRITGATLTFNPLTLENQGEYFCVSPKYHLLKVVSVKIRHQSSSTGLETKAQNLRYPIGRRKRSDGSNGIHNSLPVSRDSKINSNLDEFSSTDWKNNSDDSEHDQWDVKKIKLHAENETQTNFVIHHDGTTNIFRIGLIVSFVLLAMIGFYRLCKCWRTGTLGPVNNRVSRITSSTTQNDCQDTCASNQMTTCTVLNENNISNAAGLQGSTNGTTQNGHIEHLSNFTMQQQASSSNSGKNPFDTDFGFNMQILNSNKNYNFPFSNDVMNNTIPSAALKEA